MTSFQAWDDANRSADVLSHGPDMDLEARDLTSQEVNDLLLQARHDDEVEVESESIEESGYTEAVHPDSVEQLARMMRADSETRLQRLADERACGGLALRLMGMSPAACERQVARLEGILNAPEELARLRAELRRQAAALAPHNLTEVIGAPPRGGRH